MFSCHTAHTSLPPLQLDVAVYSDSPQKPSWSKKCILQAKDDGAAQIALWLKFALHYVALSLTCEVEALVCVSLEHF